MKTDAWRHFLPRHLQGATEAFQQLIVEAAVHESGHAVMAVLQQVEFDSISMTSEVVPMPGCPGRMAWAGGGFILKRSPRVTQFAEVGTILAAGSTSTRLILGWANPNADLQDKADFEEALAKTKAVYPDLGELDAADYSEFVKQADKLLRETSGGLEAIEHIAITLLVKQKLMGSEVASRIGVFLENKDVPS